MTCSSFSCGTAPEGSVATTWCTAYLRDYVNRDERIPHVARLTDGALTHTSALLSEGERKTSVVYNKLLRDMHAQDGLNVRLDAPAGVHVALLFADSAKDGGWSSDQVKMIERLRPHIRQFGSVRHALVEAGALGASLQGLLDNTETCVIQLDRFGRIVAANDVAGGMLRRRDASIAPGGVSSRHGDGGERRVAAAAGSCHPTIRQSRDRGIDDTPGLFALQGLDHSHASRTGGVDGRSYTPRLRNSCWRCARRRRSGSIRISWRWPLASRARKAGWPQCWPPGTA